MSAVAICIRVTAAGLVERTPQSDAPRIRIPEHQRLPGGSTGASAASLLARLRTGRRKVGGSNDLSLRDLVLRGDRHFRRRGDARRTAALELGGTKTREHRELEGVHSGRTLDHRELSVLRSPPLYMQRAGTAHGVVQQLECDGVADGQIIERRILLHVAAMKEDLATACEADEPVALPDEQLDDPPR